MERSRVKLVNRSSTYETAPVGYLDQPMFLNMAVEVETELTPEALLKTLLAIERDLGRVRTIRNGPRTVDLDILLYGSQIVQLPDLRIPHPRMLERLFVLEPLAEIAPDLVHPTAHKTIAQLLSDFRRAAPRP